MCEKIERIISIMVEEGYDALTEQQKLLFDQYQANLDPGEQS